MNAVSPHKLTPALSSHYYNSRIGRSHSELNEPSLAVVTDFREKPLYTSENPNRFNSKVSILMNAYLYLAHQSEVIRLESIGAVKVRYHENLNTIKLLSDKKRIFDDKPITDLKNKIYDVYNERQNENWDGYGAEPLKFLPQSLKFAESLFSESRLLVESVDIIPENDGCLCFEWYKSDDKFITVSVKDEKLIYNYEINGEKGCGERNFYGKKDIIEKIKQVT